MIESNKYNYIISLLNILCLFIFSLKTIITITLGFLAIKYKYKSYLSSFLFMLIWTMSSLINSIIWLISLLFYETISNSDYLFKIKKIIDDIVVIQANKLNNEQDYKCNIFVKFWNKISKISTVVNHKIIIFYTEFEKSNIGNYLEKVNNKIETYFLKLNTEHKTQEKTTLNDLLKYNNIDHKEIKHKIENVKNTTPDNLHDSMNNLNNMLKTVENLQKVMNDVGKFGGKKNRKIKRKFKNM